MQRFLLTTVGLGLVVCGLALLLQPVHFLGIIALENPPSWPASIVILIGAAMMTAVYLREK